MPPSSVMISTSDDLVQYAKSGKTPRLKMPKRPPARPGEGAREDEGRELVAPHVDADELRALGILADRGQHAPERRADDAPQEPRGRAPTRTRVRK